MPVAAADRDRAAGFAHHFLAERLRQMTQAKVRQRCITQRHR